MNCNLCQKEIKFSETCLECSTSITKTMFEEDQARIRGLESELKITKANLENAESILEKHTNMDDSIGDIAIEYFNNKEKTE